ncbi:MAG TPA: hypothetical protein VLZ83_15710 [Edaphocola sp.]|nr:hypothetical protein [Edaphocola sp.]
MKLNNLVKYTAVATVLFVGFTACKKYAGDSYDFSDTAKKYVKMKAGQSIEINTETVDTFVIDGVDTFEAFYYIPDEEPATVLLETREGIPNLLTVGIELKTDESTRTIQGTIPAFTTAGKATFTIDDDDFGSEDELEGTLTIKTVTGHDMAIGYPTPTSGIKVPFVANKPYVVHLVEE